MRSFYFTCILLVGLFSLGNAQSDYAMLFSTANNKNATIQITQSEVKKNTFSLFLNVNWVNENLKTVQLPEGYVCVVEEELREKLPESLELLTDASKLVDNKRVELKFSVKADFQGGKLTFPIPFQYAKTYSDVENQIFDKILFRQPKSLMATIVIDASELEDITAPQIVLVSPISRGFKAQEKDTTFITSEKTITISAKVIENQKLEYVKINNQRVGADADGNYTSTIFLRTGENQIRVVAVDDSKNVSELSLTAMCTYQYDIKIKEGKYYALLIGAQEYPDPDIQSLTNPVKDAENLKQLLSSRYIFEESNIIVAKNPTRQELLLKLEYLSDVVGPEDNVLIFYAGHGIWDDKKEIGYWLPTDATKNSKVNWLNNSTIKDYIRAINSKHTLMVSDACFSGSIFRSRSTDSESVVAYNKLYTLPSRKGMTSGTLREVPDESVFIKYLVKRLQENTNKYLPAEKLFSSMRSAVLNNSQNVPQYGTIQDTGDEGGEFIFVLR